MDIWYKSEEKLPERYTRVIVDIQRYAKNLLCIRSMIGRTEYWLSYDQLDYFSIKGTYWRYLKENE